jgi:hypothetical protein
MLYTGAGSVAVVEEEDMMNGEEGKGGEERRVIGMTIAVRVSGWCDGCSYVCSTIPLCIKAVTLVGIDLICRD